VTPLAASGKPRNFPAATGDHRVASGGRHPPEKRTVALDGRSRADHPGVRRRFDEHLALLDLLATLSPDRREAFVATQVLGLSYAEAAEVCGCPVGTIRSRVARARNDLIAAMAPKRAAG
jgi:RNA polymerase sigma-70 factor (ECF subfamily)